MVYPLDQVSIRFYPETLVIASYLRVFFAECPPKSCLEYFGHFGAKIWFPNIVPKIMNSLFTERGLLNNNLPANNIYRVNYA